MAHKTLIGGTAYNVTSGTSMVSGTTYNIASGKTLINGTGYDINFFVPTKTAMLYSDGSFVFQGGDEIAAGKSLIASYTDFEDATNPPWNGKQNSFRTVNFNIEVAPTSMANWFLRAKNMVADLSTFSNLNIKKVTNMSLTYHNCSNITGSPVCGDNVINMSSTYHNCSNLTGSPVCGDNVINMSHTYSHCYKLTGSPICGDNVVNMSYAYWNCSNLTGYPVCGKNVRDMYYSYYNCSNLTGSPICGENVTYMSHAYPHCSNLTGSPVCGEKVTNMSNAYFNCYNMTGSPICGEKVANMNSAYYGCSNLTGSPVCGKNVRDMAFTYYYCHNLSGNAYFYSSVVYSMWSCFTGRNTSNRLNIYVVSNSNTNTTIHYSNTYSIVGSNITWTDVGSYQYNAAYNIYIYPVENVTAARAVNGD